MEEHVRGITNEHPGGCLTNGRSAPNGGSFNAPSIVDTNAGTMQVANGGEIKTQSIVLGGGNALISGTSTLEYGGISDNNVTFADGAAGTLILDHASQFTGTVAGLNSTAPFDILDLADIGFSANTSLSFTSNSQNTGGTLTVSDGTNTANILLLGQYSAASFAIASDGHGGTSVVDPAATQSTTHSLATPLAS